MKIKIFIVAALFISSHLHAQEDTVSRIMNEVVITANKFPQKQSGTGKVISVITREEIMQSGGKDLSQLLNEQAGVVVNGANSNPGKDKTLFLRGATDQYTLILLDGVPLNDPSGTGGTYDLRLLSLENIERIEILKGSQSTLYGSNAVAGVINIISKKPTTQKPLFNGLITYGSYNSLKANTEIGQKIKWLEYDVNYAYTNTDGISEARDTTGKANFDKDGFTKHAIQTLIGINLSDKCKISPYYRFSQFKGDYDADVFLDSDLNHYTASLINTGVTGYFKYGKGTFHLNYAYDFTNRNYTSQFGEYTAKGRFHHAEAYADHSFNKNVQLVGGVNYQSYHIDAPDTAKSILSAYASLFLRSGQGLNLELGSRWNYHNQYGNNFTYSFNPSYLVHNNFKIFINLTSGFRPPAVSELFGPFGSNPDLKPERSTTQEGGFQVVLPKTDIELTMTGFNRTINNVIIYGNNGYENRDKQHDYGVEIEGSYAISRQINIKLNYAYVDGRVTQRTGGKDTSYYNLIRRPRNNVQLFISYKFKDLFISSSLQFTGKRTDNDYRNYPPTEVKLNSYALWNMYAEYSFLKKRLNIFIDAKNITGNKDYYEVYGYSVQGFNVAGGVRFHL